jgi:hypothetical protein
MFQKKKIFKKIEKIKKINKYYEKTKAWYDEELSSTNQNKLKDYLSTFTFSSSEKENLEDYIKQCIQEKTFSFSLLCEKDKFLTIIKELLLKYSSENIKLFQKFKSIITPFLNNEITTFIRNDDDVTRMMSIFFFYPVYSIFPLVSSYTKTKIINGFLKSEEEQFIYQMQKIIETFLKIPNENYQFSIMCYLLIDKYMDEEVFEKNVRKKFLYFCHHTFVNKSCKIPNDESTNSDYIAFKHYFDALVKIYNIQTYDYLYDFMIYLFESLHRTSIKQNSEDNTIDKELIYKETFSKSYLTIYFFILMSNLELKAQKSEIIEENAKKAFVIQCFDDICDIYQDMKNNIYTIYTCEIKNQNKSLLESEIKNIFEKYKFFLYESLYEKHPLLCRTLIYITLHIEVFLIYKNKQYVSKEFYEEFFEHKYYNSEMFEVLKLDLFSSTTVLVNLLKKWCEI